MKPVVDREDQEMAAPPAGESRSGRKGFPPGWRGLLAWLRDLFRYKIRFVPLAQGKRAETGEGERLRRVRRTGSGLFASRRTKARTVAATCLAGIGAGLLLFLLVAPRIPPSPLTSRGMETIPEAAGGPNPPEPPAEPEPSQPEVVPTAEEEPPNADAEPGGEEGEEVEEEPEQPIQWADPAFEQAIRNAMNIPSGEEILPSRLTGVTSIKILGEHSVVNGSLNTRNTTEGYWLNGELYGGRGEIRTLKDAAHFPNLKKLTVGYHQVGDVSGIGSLDKLETLGLYFNEIQDIREVSGLSGLKYLYLYGNHIRDLSPVASLTNLEHLWVQYNEIGGIEAVSGLDKLRELYVSHNRIEDITPVSGLKRLKFFYADGNSIRSIAPVEAVATLTDASFLDNPVSDLSPGDHIPNLNKSYGSGSGSA